MVLWAYEGEDEMNFTSDAGFLLLSGRLHSAISNVCVAGSVLPSPTTDSRTQEGFFMSIGRQKFPQEFKFKF